MTPGQIVVLTLLGTCAAVAVAGFPWELSPRTRNLIREVASFAFGVAVLALVTTVAVAR